MVQFIYAEHVAQLSTHVQPAKPRRKRKHVPHHKRPKEFVHRRNNRERRRVHNVNFAFEVLRQHVPVIRCDDKTSKISILRHASSYIQRLMQALQTADDVGCPIDQTSAGPQMPPSYLWARDEIQGQVAASFLHRLQRDDCGGQQYQVHPWQPSMSQGAGLFNNNDLTMNLERSALVLGTPQNTHWNAHPGLILQNEGRMAHDCQCDSSALTLSDDSQGGVQGSLATSRPTDFKFLSQQYEHGGLGRCCVESRVGMEHPTHLGINCPQAAKRQWENCGVVSFKAASCYL